eukprot:CAMPEP_0184489980 /NCGR_PEP_ID=MMETSP0113_2-20130426/16827_1 /TAXON_ID=91329 /ORGANISM="Norrisiella sphaerica, Strain BC52" /LENGTH=405 /DNA_ID=CAMNT_0026873681 /DNA_START=427 /DNA_END=1644 /DNA_ORIENTATION=+
MASDYEQTSWIKQLLKATVFAGAITGQLVMGYVGDLLGRNKAMAITIALAGIGALASALFAWGDDWAVYGIIAASRFILGVGVGGVYPLSATKAAEESETMDLQKRNLRVSLAFFWQTPGAIAPYIVTLILIFIVPSDEAQWRILFAVGAIPSVFILYGSLGTADSVEFRRNKGEISTWSLLQEKSNWHKLLGTGGCWLIYDVVYYGTNLFSPTIVGKIFGEGDDIKKEAWQNIVVQSAGIPALALGIWCQQRYGTKPLQFWGFLFIAVCFLILGILFEPLKDQPKSLFTLYIILLFSLNFGANITTFILPAEVYPSHVRSTMNGISAALGKVGAIIGTIIYQPIYDQFGITTLMCVAAVFALGGVVLTHFTIHPPKEIHNITQLTQPEAERELKDTEEADQMLT